MPERQIGGYGFTLVELIIVITILSILATIAFISFQGYTKDARDGVRMSDIKQIYNGLSIYKVQTEKTLLPDNYIEVQSGTTTISYQGYAGASVLKTLKISGGKDPGTKDYYIYTTDVNTKKAQLMTYMETSDKDVQLLSKLNKLNIINQAQATNSGYYQDKKIYVYGDKIGILTDSNKVPLQETTTNTGVNIITLTTPITTYFGGSVYSGGLSTSTGLTLINQINGALNNTLPCSSTTYEGYDIISLQDKQSGTFTKTGTITGGSQTGSILATCNNGTLSYGTESLQTSCNLNYTLNGSTCDANTRINQSCTGLPASNAIWNTVNTVNQIWNGVSWSPSTIGTYNTTSSITNCYYKCNTNYHTEDSGLTCTSDTRSCTITNGTGQQTWNIGGSSWGSCTVTSCDSGYTISGNSCIVIPHGTVVFNYTGGSQSWTVPAGVTTTIIEAWGGGGAAGECNLLSTAYGGGAAAGSLTKSVQPGSIISIYVAGGGKTAQTNPDPSNNGGYGAGGGGATYVMSGSISLIVVGGGGGAGGGAIGGAGTSTSVGGNGIVGWVNAGGAGGTAGNGGLIGVEYDSNQGHKPSGGGAGISGNGGYETPIQNSTITPAMAGPGGAGGGSISSNIAVGGYGGGGYGSWSAGGGGGGYSGGGGGGYYGGGGGGGSYIISGGTLYSGNNINPGNMNATYTTYGTSGKVGQGSNLCANQLNANGGNGLVVISY